MKKQSLSLVAIAAAALFSIGASAQTAPLQSDRSFDFNMFYSSKMPMETMVSKDQYMREMERRWNMAEKMMGPDGKKGWASHAMLMKAISDTSPVAGGAQ